MAESEAFTAGSRDGRGEAAVDQSRTPVANAAERKNATKIIHIVYVIAALDVTWMFLQFSVTPVSISAMTATQYSPGPRFPCAH